MTCKTRVKKLPLEDKLILPHYVKYSLKRVSGPVSKDLLKLRIRICKTVILRNWGLSYKEIGKKINLSVERTRQLHLRYLRYKHWFGIKKVQRGLEQFLRCL